MSMRKIFFSKEILLYFILPGICACSPTKNNFKIHDESGVLEHTKAPISIAVKLNKSQVSMAKEGRLGVGDPSTKKGEKSLIPVQLESDEQDASQHAVMIMPREGPGLHQYILIENKSPFSAVMTAKLDPASGQVIIEESGKKVLQYNYKTVYLKDVIRPESTKDQEMLFSKMSDGAYYEEYLKAHPTYPKDTVVTSAIYSVPRSDYIHPLYGLKGEMLTSDWPDGGHPHHRGIFWAWPEVEYKGELGDLYALQRVFARPTGNITYESGPVFAQIKAENLWLWEDKKPIVQEQAIIRVYRSDSNSRVIDLTISLKAVEDSVTIATRFTNSYGGLNIKMQTPEEQNISHFTDKPNSDPVRAWSDLSGIFEGDQVESGMMILQNHTNPEYPGAWAEYPNLSWVQPTFPTPGTRYTLGKEKPLILRYRLIIHNGGKPDENISKNRWDAYNSTLAPQSDESIKTP